jgi:hypothetical protein
VVHPLADILRARILAIACGYEDADDLDHLRRDPGFKLACGRLLDSGRDLCSQPTISRWENAPSLREVIRLMRAMVELYCASYPKPPGSVTLDIDDTLDVVHGRQQLSLFNAHYDERCFLPSRAQPPNSAARDPQHVGAAHGARRVAAREQEQRGRRGPAASAQPRRPHGTGLNPRSGSRPPRSRAG